jgi:CrcB protein
MGQLAAVAIGGGIGAMLRYLFAGWVAGLISGPLPVAILMINVLGSFAMGVLAEGFALRFDVSPEMRAFLTVGILGGFTTFSSFSLEAALLIRRDELLLAGLYVALSVGLSIAGLFLGLWLVRILVD